MPISPPDDLTAGLRIAQIAQPGISCHQQNTIGGDPVCALPHVTPSDAIDFATWAIGTTTTPGTSAICTNAAGCPSTLFDRLGRYETAATLADSPYGALLTDHHPEITTPRHPRSKLLATRPTNPSHPREHMTTTPATYATTHRPYPEQS